MAAFPVLAPIAAGLLHGRSPPSAAHRFNGGIEQGGKGELDALHACRKFRK